MPYDKFADDHCSLPVYRRPSRNSNPKRHIRSLEQLFCLLTAVHRLCWSKSICVLICDVNITCEGCTSPDQFLCDNGQCVTVLSRCKGYHYCSDYSDQANCCEYWLRSTGFDCLRIRLTYYIYLAYIYSLLGHSWAYSILNWMCFMCNRICHLSCKSVKLWICDAENQANKLCICAPTLFLNTRCNVYEWTK
jgi:Low-density lipoprotein receptor domain class A